MTEEKATTATTRTKGVPLPPDQIKAKMLAMEGQPFDAVAKACGFYTEITHTATGATEIRVTTADQMAFAKSSLEAQTGIRLAPPARPYRRSNRSPIIKIGKNGNIVVGGRHSAVAGFPFGDTVDSYVHVEAQPGRIVITLSSDGSDAPAEHDSDDLDSDLDGDDLDV